LAIDYFLSGQLSERSIEKAGWTNLPFLLIRPRKNYDFQPRKTPEKKRASQRSEILFATTTFSFRAFPFFLCILGIFFAFIVIRPHQKKRRRRPPLLSSAQLRCAREKRALYRLRRNFPHKRRRLKSLPSIPFQREEEGQKGNFEGF